MQLSESDKNFFSLVDQAVLTNPFNDERIAIDLRIANVSSATPAEKRTKKIIQHVRNRISRLSAITPFQLNFVKGEDRQLLLHVFLFDFFYQFRKKFDQLIIEQIEAGETSIKVSFAHKAISYLINRGFEPEAANHYFALCYQLRRAFYFIRQYLVGTSPCIKELRASLWNNIFTFNIGLYDRYLWDRMEDFSTLLLGETGTGKGTAAKAMGQSAFIPFDDKKMQFHESFVQSLISINLSQFPETLIESELFGHKKGAFTGAVDNHLGVFSRCSPYGSIFLDEIGEVSTPIQIKLLHTLQERTFCPVGSHRSSKFHGRVIASTNRTLYEIRDKGLLRNDFFYRLCSDIITVPPLRKRLEENPAELTDLLELTIERLLGKPSLEIVHMVEKTIKTQLGDSYPWPGNVRELEQCVRRILLKQSYSAAIQSETPDLRTQLIDGINQGSLDANSLISGYCNLLYRIHGTFETVAKITNLDRRTVKKYILEWDEKKNE